MRRIDLTHLFVLLPKCRDEAEVLIMTPGDADGNATETSPLWNPPKTNGKLIDDTLANGLVPDNDIDQNEAQLDRQASIDPSRAAQFQGNEEVL